MATEIQHVNYHRAAPAMLAALKVVALDGRISEWLREHDPQALKQIDNAIADAEQFDVPPAVAARIAARQAQTTKRSCQSCGGILRPAERIDGPAKAGECCCWQKVLRCPHRMTGAGRCTRPEGHPGRHTCARAQKASGA